MAKVPLIFALQSHTGDTRISSLERCVNLIPEQNVAIQAGQRGPAQVVLRGAPGIRPQIWVGDDIIHLHSVNDRYLYGWSKTALYKLNQSSGTAHKIFEASFNKNISSAHGLTIQPSGREDLIMWWVDGNTGYALNTFDDSIEQITDTEFLPSDSTVYLDSIAIFARRNSDEIFWSDITDYTSINGLNFARAEGFSDRTERILTIDRELWIFGRQTIEIFYNTGDQDSQFERLGNAYFDIGCANGDTVVRLGRDAVWVGDDLRVYRSAARSYREERVSEHQGVEHALSKYGVEGAKAWGARIEGHEYYWLDIPAADQTYVYDKTTDLWHERATYDKDKIACSNVRKPTYGRHHLSAMTMHNNQNVVAMNKQVGILDFHYNFDTDIKIMREAGTSAIVANDDETTFNFVELQFQNSIDPVGDGCKPDENNWVRLEFTDDQAKTWKVAGEKPIVRDDKDYFPFFKALGKARWRAFRWRTYWSGDVVFNRSVMDIE